MCGIIHSVHCSLVEMNLRPKRLMITKSDSDLIQSKLVVELHGNLKQMSQHCVSALSLTGVSALSDFCLSF